MEFRAVGTVIEKVSDPIIDVIRNSHIRHRTSAKIAREQNLINNIDILGYLVNRPIRGEIMLG